MLWLLGVMVVVVLARIAFQPTPSAFSQSSISLTLGGYTNDGLTGGRLALFSVTNRSDSSVYFYGPMVLNVVYTSANRPGWHDTLRGRASASFAIPVPRNQPSWTVSLLADPDIGLGSEIKHAIFPIARRHPYLIQSGIITN